MDYSYGEPGQAAKKWGTVEYAVEKLRNLYDLVAREHGLARKIRVLGIALKEHPRLRWGAIGSACIVAALIAAGVVLTGKPGTRQISAVSGNAGNGETRAQGTSIEDIAFNSKQVFTDTAAVMAGFSESYMLWKRAYSNRDSALFYACYAEPSRPNAGRSGEASRAFWRNYFAGPATVELATGEIKYVAISPQSVSVEFSVRVSPAGSGVTCFQTWIPDSLVWVIAYEKITRQEKQ